jgi:hypothetical protein
VLGEDLKGHPHFLRSAQLVHSTHRSPTGVGGSHVDVEPVAEGEAQSIGERQSLASTPPAGRHSASS